MPDYWDNPNNLEDKCPLCGNTRTRFVDVYSDGDEHVELSFVRQQCKGCGLSCKHWAGINYLKAELERLKGELAA